MAVSLLGRPSEQVWFAMGPSVPCVGGSTIENVSSQLSTSAPLNVVSTATAWSVVAEPSAALGGNGFARGRNCTAAVWSGVITTLPYCWPTLVGAAVGTVNCHCWASMSVRTSGDAALSVSFEKK